MSSLESSHLSMLGIDLGNWSCHVMYDSGSPEDLHLGLWSGNANIDGYWRYWSGHVKTQISQIKCLLGRKFSDPDLQMELDYVPFRVIEGPDGFPLVHSRCKGEDRAFTPVEILAMLISYLEFLTREPQFLARFPVEECGDFSPCIGIPMYFTDHQKKDVLQAAKIAGASASFCILDETTAMVVPVARKLSFGFQRIVAFVDIGHASMQVCFAEFNGDCSSSIHQVIRGEDYTINILYKGYSRSLGGREFDKVLFKHFASKIRNEYNIDVFENSSACVRLSEACESLKIDLSEKIEASFCLKKFSGSIDVEGSITRIDFERMSILILQKIEVALMKALSESGLNVEKIDFIEVVGKGCLIPAIIDILTNFFGKKLRMTTDYEHVARGCAMEQARQHNIMGTNKMIIDLDASEIVSSALNSEEEKADDSEKSLWRSAINEEGHLLTFISDFLEENMHSIKRSEKTKEELYWLSKEKYFVEYSYSELQDATNKFHESFKLGEGGFGIVYKGILNKNKTVAIKIMKEGSSQGAKEFNREVEILSKVQHPNLVKLIGACAETCALIYEYLPNGSLEDRLRCKKDTPPLSWQARVHIAYGICSALSFLHCSEPHGIVHGDLKPDNILLDGNDTVKICDFGLCRELDYTASASIPYHWTDCPKGTFAYMDPEYLSTGKTTPQYDVYSFGIILLLLVTCKDPRGLRNLVKDVEKKGSLKELIDTSAGFWPFKEAKKMISLGLRCSDPVRNNRPDLSTKVLKELKSMLQVASSSPSSWAASLFRR